MGIVSCITEVMTATHGSECEYVDKCNGWCIFNFNFYFFFTFIKKAVMFNVFCSATCVSVFYMTPTQGDLVNFYFQRGDQ